ncbi:MAG: sigma-70 region 4 domain-containing protein [Anaerolineales bacterium]
MRRLDQKDQQVIYLRYFLEVPIAEAAAVLGVAEGTVKSRTHRALNRLQAVIDRDFPSLREGWTE